MSVAASGEFSLSVDYLSEMFADSATWRAVVASPLISWPDMLTLIAAGTSSEANARAKVVPWVWQEVADHPDYAAIPLIVVRADSLRSERRGDTGFDLAGRLIATIFLPVPTAYVDTKGRYTRDGGMDAANKIGRINAEVRELPRLNGRLDIRSPEITDFCFIHPKDGIAGCFSGEISVEWVGSS